jgi:hypothetical protein
VRDMPCSKARSLVTESWRKDHDGRLAIFEGCASADAPKRRRRFGVAPFSVRMLEFFQRIAEELLPHVGRGGEGVRLLY